VEAAVRLKHFFRVAATHDETTRYHGDYLLTEPSFADVFDVPVAHGDVRSALGAMAAFLLGIAVINYVNLATARAGERAQEAGGARPSARRWPSCSCSAG
jgi:hypothetical protein